MGDLKGKIISGVRNRYFNETDEEYENSEHKVRFFAVIEDYGDEVLVSQLSFFRSIDPNSLKINKNVYKFLRADVIFAASLSLLSKSNIKYVFDKGLLSRDYSNVVKDINNVNFDYLDSRTCDKVREFLFQYNKEKIKVGSVVTLKLSQSEFVTYYVVSKSDDTYKGLLVNCDPKKGFVMDDIVYHDIDYSSLISLIFMSDILESRINDLVKDAKLRLVK